jgi:hypothetical protein
MNKYNIEGGIDFFAELYKSLDIEESEEKTEEDNNKCLITNQNLKDKHVTMDCGHKFNYIPLYNDIMNHKKKFNNMEAIHSKLNINEIRCPYCRKRQIGTLIYYEELGLAKVNGVNFYDPNLKHSHSNHTYTIHKCEYKWINNNYNPNKPESQTNSKYINNQSCDNYLAKQISVYNPENPSQPITYGDTNYYCYAHKKEMIEQYKLQQKKNQMTENVVLGPLNLENQTGCVQILKTGPNKGKQCGCKINLENMCKRHYLLNHKELITNN